jgi:alpha-mannosidase
MLHGKPYPSEMMTDAWKKKLFLVMHDVVPGCGVDEIYDEAWEYIGDIRRQMPKIMASSMRYLTAGDEPSRHIVVFNPNNWPVRDYVEADLELVEGWFSAPGVVGEAGEVSTEEVEVTRWDDGSISKARVGFIAEAPPLSYKIYSITRGSKASPPNAVANGDRITTDSFSVEVDDRTGIVTVLSREGRPIMRGNEIIIDEELGDLYFHRGLLEKNIGSESGEGLHFGVFKPETYEVEQGPVRKTITFRNDYYCLRWPYYLVEKYKPLLYRHKTLEVTKKVIVYHDIPRIDFATRINLLQPHVRVRLKLDTCMVAPVYTRQTQFGAATLPHSKSLQESFKTPSLSWIAAEEGGRGLAVLSLGVPINEVKGGEIYCTLLRSVSVLSNDGISGPLIPTPKAQELGEHNYRYSVYPYGGRWQDAGVHRRGFETAQPLFTMQCERKPATNELASFTLDPDNLIVAALKKAEDDDSLILRFFETCGKPCRARIGLPPAISSAWTVNLLEDVEEEIEIRGNVLEMDVGAFEIVSLKMKR